MKKYCCPSCSASFLSRPYNLSCPDCGAAVDESEWRIVEEEAPPKPENATCIHLTGDLGVLVMHKLPLSQDVGSPLLRSVTSRAAVAERVQFSISWEDHACFVTPLPDTKNATAVNGSIIERKTELRQGDTLSVCGRRSKAVGFELTVVYFA